jgi:hypothetical protein
VSTAQPRELVHYLLLSEPEKRAAIRRMAANGWSHYGIASATRLAVEEVRRVLAGPDPGAPDAERTP